MTTDSTNIRVYIASPSDVVEERNILEQIVDDLNKLLGAKTGFRLELVKWETDTYPGLGEDAQGVINEQIDDDYDIFIGILWKRFGTPTKRGPSGTAEEFSNAYQKARNEPNKLRVMFYFNNSSAPMSEINAEQLMKVKQFQDSLGEMGVYYWTYNGIDDFERYVRLHLGKAMQDFRSTWGQAAGLTTEIINTPISHTDSRPEPEQESENEEGFLDLIIQTVDEFGVGTETFNRIATLLQELNEKTVQRTGEMNQLSKPINPSQARLVTNRFADDWEDFVERMKVEIPILSKAFRSGIDGWTKSAQLLDDFNNDEESRAQIESALGVLDSFVNNMAEAKTQTKGFRDIVAGMPRLTVKFNHARKHILEILDNLSEEYDTEENLSIEARRAFSEALRRH